MKRNHIHTKRVPEEEKEKGTKSMLKKIPESEERNGTLDP